MKNPTQRFFLIAVLMFIAWNAGFLVRAQEPVVPVPAEAVPPSEVIPDQPALPTTEVPSPAAPDHSGDQVMWALIASYFMNHLKRTKWFPLLSEQTTSQVKAFWGFGLAVLTAFGINVAISGSVFAETGMAVTITGISWKVFKDVVWQWAAQQGWYDLIVRRGQADEPVPVKAWST